MSRSPLRAQVGDQIVAPLPGQAGDAAWGQQFLVHEMGVGLFDVGDQRVVLGERRFEIGLVGESAGSEKAVDWGQGNGEGGGVLETGEDVLETGEIVGRTIRAAGRLVFLRAAGKNDARGIGPRSINSVIQRERGSMRGALRRGSSPDSRRAAGLIRPLAAAGLSGQDSRLILPTRPVFFQFGEIAKLGERRRREVRQRKQDGLDAGQTEFTCLDRASSPAQAAMNT